MTDFPIELRAETLRPELVSRLARVVDVESKIPRALDALGSLPGQDVILLGGGPLRAAQLEEIGARLRVVDVATGPATPSTQDAESKRASGSHDGRKHGLELPDESADAIVACWSAFRGPSSAEATEADRVLRPGGRLLVLHDYGRDEVSQLWPGAQADHFAWSRRDGWFLRSGFKIRVVHCWWSFASIDEARDLLTEVAGDVAAPVVAAMKRPRLSYNVAVYHRTRGAVGAGRVDETSSGAAETPSAGQTPSAVPAAGEQPAS